MTWQAEMRGAVKEFLPSVDSHYPSFIPKDYLKHIELSDSEALRKQFIPSELELDKRGHTDPIGDQVKLKEPGIIHRYRNRILFTPTTVCPIHCRYCFRKNELHSSPEIFRSNLNKLESYLSKSPCIEEVILTGGDPFSLSNQKIKDLFEIINKFSHIKFIRFHSRFPIIMPTRFDQELKLLLKNQNSKKEVIIAVHCNHIDEITLESEKTIKLLSRDLHLLSQTVLLAGVNDSSETLKELIYKFHHLGVTPYYLHHPDEVQGAMHFYLSLKEGSYIYSQLRDILPGWLIPHYVIDNNLGTGKELALAQQNQKKSLSS